MWTVTVRNIVVHRLGTHVEILLKVLGTTGL
jgi:hypothetical protein